MRKKYSFILILLLLPTWTKGQDREVIYLECVLQKPLAYLELSEDVEPNTYAADGTPIIGSLTPYHAATAGERLEQFEKSLIIVETIPDKPNSFGDSPLNSGNYWMEIMLFEEGFKYQDRNLLGNSAEDLITSSHESNKVVGINHAELGTTEIKLYNQQGAKSNLDKKIDRLSGIAESYDWFDGNIIAKSNCEPLSKQELLIEVDSYLSQIESELALIESRRKF